MQRYPVRTTHRANLQPGPLESIVRAHFESVEVAAPAIRGRYGAIERIEVRPDGRDLTVETTMNPKVDETVARETIQRYNAFLLAVTGYSSKERAKRIQKAAKAGGA